MSDDLVFEPASYSRFEAAEESAKKKGLVVIAPKPNELFVDIDDRFGLQMFERNILKVLELPEMVGATVVRRTSPSGSPKRFHIVVTLPKPIDNVERIALQAILGSDPTREVLSWQRHRRGDPVPTLFFEKPKAK